jgi:hypothetical protein
MCQPGWQRSVLQLAINPCLGSYLPVLLSLSFHLSCLSPTAASSAAGNCAVLREAASPCSRSTRMRGLDTAAKLPSLYYLSTDRRGRAGAGHKRCGRGDEPTTVTAGAVRFSSFHACSHCFAAPSLARARFDAPPARQLLPHPGRVPAGGGARSQDGSPYSRRALHAGRRHVRFTYRVFLILGKCLVPAPEAPATLKPR